MPVHIIFKTVLRVTSFLAGRKIDFLFIDGDHEYNGVSKDFHSYRQLVATNGVISFHDIVPDYLTRYNKNTGMWVGEVPKFWSEIKTKYNSDEIVENYEQDGLGIGVLILEQTPIAVKH